MDLASLIQVGGFGIAFSGLAFMFIKERSRLSHELGQMSAIIGNLHAEVSDLRSNQVSRELLAAQLIALKESVRADLAECRSNDHACHR